MINIDQKFLVLQNYIKKGSRNMYISLQLRKLSRFCGKFFSTGQY